VNELTSPERSEAETRKELIDPQLIKAGWKIVDSYDPRLDIQIVREHPTSSGPADYIFYIGDKTIAGLEAKKESVEPDNVLSQTQRYARDIQNSHYTFGEYHIPFGYSSNGHKIIFRDFRQRGSFSREIKAFHRPAALTNMLGRATDSSEFWLKSNEITHSWLRPYQIEAVKAIEDAIIKRKRKMMVAMATGTGKTVTVIELIHRLLKSGMVRRVLFLVDRRALAAQAVGAMAAFEAEPGLKFDRIYEVYSQQFRREDLEDDVFNPKVLPNEYLTNPKSGTSFVYVSTIQRMRINLFGYPSESTETGDEEEIADAEQLDIPIDAFDLIIADECHRGYTTLETGKWREVLDYFDAIKVGLTATPALHTKAYFDDIVYQYDYQQAVRDGWLVDYDPVLIKSDIRMNGLFLRPGEEIESVDTDTGRKRLEVLEDEREFNTTDLERAITAPDSNKKIVQEYLKYALDFESKRGHFPKTIVFATNDISHRSHAEQLVSFLRSECGRGDDFVQKITGNPNVDRPLQRIKEFRNRKLPAIVVSVDMLTTGVDIPSVEAIIFIRPVKSRILFEQMLGRGTRKCPDIHKSHFIVFDAAGVLDYFSKATAFTTDPPSEPTKPIKEIIGSINDARDRDYNVRVLIKRLQRMDKSISSEGRTRISEFIPNGDIAGFARDLSNKIKTDFVGIMGTLNDPGFQTLLENYPRPPATFIVAPGKEDVVTSTPVFKTRNGQELKPDDYIQAFTKFVKENPDHITALEILLKKPKEFTYSDLEELRAELRDREENFSEENLRKAYDNELTDIISIIHHAASGEPLGTTQERVRRAVDKIRQQMSLTPQQEEWLGLIEDHLSRNLLIEKEHFSSIPFSRHGAWKRADADFGGILETLLREINAAVVQ